MQDEWKKGLNARFDIHTRNNVNQVDLTRCDRLARDLPLSKEFRPTWDIGILSKLGFRDIDIRFMDTKGYITDTGTGSIHTPIGFAICARLPYSNVSLVDGDYDELKPVEEIINRMATNITDVWHILSNDGLVKILLSLYTVNLTITQTAELLGCSYALASHNLNKLKDTGLIDSAKINGEKTFFLTNREVVNDLCILTNRIMKKQNDTTGL